MPCGSRNEHHHDHSHNVTGQRSERSRHAPHSHRHPKTQPHGRRGPGRPTRELSGKFARCVIRCYVKTGVQLVRLCDAVKEGGGPKSTKVRGFLQKVSDTGPERSKTLGEVRIRNNNLKARRERQQNEACDNYRRSRDEQRQQQTTAPSLRDLPRDLDQPPSSSLADLFFSTDQADLRSDSFTDPAVNQYSDEIDFHSMLGAHGPFFSEAAIRSGQHAESSPSQQLPLPRSENNLGRSPGQESDDSDDDSKSDANMEAQEVNVDTQRKRKKRILRDNPRISRLLRFLNQHLSPAKARLNKFLVRQLTVTEEPVQSRVGTDAWLPQHDEDSEYIGFYHFPWAQDEQTGVLPIDSGGSSAMQVAQGIPDPPAVTFFKRAKLESIDNGMDSISDAEVAHELENILSTMSSFDRTAWVNAQDNNGVAALALAIAYGLPAICGQLLDCEADHRMKTVRGARPHNFALAAERIAGQTNCLKLYTRIMMCREFVRYGISPTTSRPSSNTGYRGLRTFDDETQSQAQTAHASEGIAAQDHAYGNRPGGTAAPAASDHQPSAKELEAYGSVGGTFSSGLLDAVVAPQRDQFITQAPVSSSTNFAVPDAWRAEMLPSANGVTQPFTTMDNALSAPTFQQPVAPGSGFPDYTDPNMLVFDPPFLSQQTANPINPPVYGNPYAESMPYQPNGPQHQGWPIQAGTWNVSEAPQDFNKFGQQEEAQGMYDHNPFRRRSQPMAHTANYIKRPLQLTPPPGNTRHTPAFTTPNIQSPSSGKPYHPAAHGLSALPQTYMSGSQEHYQSQTSPPTSRRTSRQDDQYQPVAFNGYGYLCQ